MTMSFSNNHNDTNDSNDQESEKQQQQQQELNHHQQQQPYERRNMEEENSAAAVVAASPTTTSSNSSTASHSEAAAAHAEEENENNNNSNENLVTALTSVPVISSQSQQEQAPEEQDEANNDQDDEIMIMEDDDDDDAAAAAAADRAAMPPPMHPNSNINNNTMTTTTTTMMNIVVPKSIGPPSVFSETASTRPPPDPPSVIDHQIMDDDDYMLKDDDDDDDIIHNSVSQILDSTALIQNERRSRSDRHADAHVLQKVLSSSASTATSPDASSSYVIHVPNNLADQNQQQKQHYNPSSTVELLPPEQSPQDTLTEHAQHNSVVLEPPAVLKQSTSVTDLPTLLLMNAAAAAAAAAEEVEWNTKESDALVDGSEPVRNANEPSSSKPVDVVIAAPPTASQQQSSSSSLLQISTSATNNNMRPPPQEPPALSPDQQSYQKKQHRTSSVQPQKNQQQQQQYHSNGSAPAVANDGHYSQQQQQQQQQHHHQHHQSHDSMSHQDYTGRPMEAPSPMEMWQDASETMIASPPQMFSQPHPHNGNMENQHHAAQQYHHETQGLSDAHTVAVMEGLLPPPAAAAAPMARESSSPHSKSNMNGQHAVTSTMTTVRQTSFLERRSLSTESDNGRVSRHSRAPSGATPGLDDSVSAFTSLPPSASVTTAAAAPPSAPYAMTTAPASSYGGGAPSNTAATAQQQQHAPAPSYAAPVPDMQRRKIHLHLCEEEVVPLKKATFLGHFRTKSGRFLESRSESQVVTHDRGLLAVSWFPGTSAVELQDHVRRSVLRKLHLPLRTVLQDFRILDESTDLAEEIVLSPHIPNGSTFTLRFSLNPDGASTPISVMRPPESPSEAPAHQMAGLSNQQMDDLTKQLDELRNPSSRSERRNKKHVLRPRKSDHTSQSRDGGDEQDSQEETSEDGSGKTEEIDPIEARLREITKLLLDDRERKQGARQEKRQVVFGLVNYFVLFLGLLAISAELHARAPDWLASLEQQLKDVRDCSANQEALFECVSRGDFAGLVASVILFLSRSVIPRRIFLFGFESPKKLWTVVYESLVTAFCWGFSYLFIRRGLNTDTRERFLQKYWKDAVYGSLAGFNAAFMKHVLKNLIPQEAVEVALRDSRQLKFLSWLPSFD